MIGTFYRSPGPDKDPFVEVGSTIKAGDKLCIIEAMKMQNVLKSEVSGKIKKVNVKAGDSVVVDEILIEMNHLRDKLNENYS